MNTKLKAVICENMIILLTSPVCLQAAYQTFPLHVFTDNTPFESDLRINLTVTDAGPGQVDFTISNLSSISSSISNIYFDSDSLAGITAIIAGQGTSFGQYPAPGNLPGWNILNPVYQANEELSIGAIPPPSISGINPGQSVTIRFALGAGSTWQSIINEISAGDLRTGVHIIDLPYGSESAVSIPEPAIIFMLVFGASTLRRRI